MFSSIRHQCKLLAIFICAAMPFPSSAAIHALIMTISDYKAPGAAPLKGVLADVENARQIARHLGVRDSDMVFLRDGQLTLEGMRSAFDGLEERISQNDQVFIYYSGHGGRQLVLEPQDRCAESLVTVDGYGFIDSELEERLKSLSTKAGKLIVFLDACHSGGVTTRSVARPDQSFVAKYYARAGGGPGSPQACSVPVNILKRNLSIKSASRSIGTGAQNYVYIAAARDNEVSLDQPGKGGVATQAWLECMGGKAKDLDGSGGITADEIRICAQDLIDTKLKNVQGFLPHHISITGNSDSVLAFAKTTEQTPVVTSTPAAPAAAPVATPVKPVPVPVAVAPTKPAAAATASPVPPPPSLPGLPLLSQKPPAPQQPVVTVSPINTLKDIFSNRDDRRSISMTPARPNFKIGRDKVEFKVSSSHDGHVYILMVGSDGKAFDLLFPNQLDKNNQIAAGQTINFPRPSWEITASGPPGKNELLVIVSDSPRDFSKLKMVPAGPFSVVEANPVSSKDIQFVSGTSSTASNSDCNDGVLKRNLTIAKSCSNGFGAAMASIEEVN